MSSVNEIRPALEGLNRKPAPAQSRDEREGDGGLANTAGRSRHDEPFGWFSHSYT
jgi:hypothetical protein